VGTSKTLKGKYEIRFPEKKKISPHEITILRDKFPQVQDIKKYDNIMVGNRDGIIVPTTMVSIMFTGRYNSCKENDTFRGKKQGLCDLYAYLHHEKGFIDSKFDIFEIKDIFDYYEGSRKTATPIRSYPQKI
jgi:hypothetical protein